MIRILLSNTILVIKLRKAITSSFVGSKGLLQGYGISGILFNIFLEDLLRRVRAAIHENESENEPHGDRNTEIYRSVKP